MSRILHVCNIVKSHKHNYTHTHTHTHKHAHTQSGVATDEHRRPLVRVLSISAAQPHEVTWNTQSPP